MAGVTNTMIEYSESVLADATTWSLPGQFIKTVRTKVKRCCLRTQADQAGGFDKFSEEVAVSRQMLLLGNVLM